MFLGGPVSLPVSCETQGESHFLLVAALWTNFLTSLQLLIFPVSSFAIPGDLLLNFSLPSYYFLVSGLWILDRLNFAIDQYSAIFFLLIFQFVHYFLCFISLISALIFFHLLIL